MKYTSLIIKNSIENVLIFPFILVGRLLYFFKGKQKCYETFFFFPFYHTGGAEKVHAQIAAAIGNKRSVIFFTRKSKDDTFLESFRSTNCDIIDISRFTDNKWIYFLNLIYRGYISHYINRQEKSPIVFNGQSNFGYKISPWLRRNIVQIELIHALNTFSFIRIPFIKNYAKAITVSNEIIEKHYKAYNNKSVPELLMQKFQAIETRIELPETRAAKDYHSPTLKVLYVGRGTKEKRVQLIAEIADKVLSKTNSVKFHFAGDVGESKFSSVSPNCIMHGNINNENDLNDIYNASHILIVTSSTESGPLVTMEAMARGLAIVTTDVGFVSNYVHNEINGYKVSMDKTEPEIVSLMFNYILVLNQERNKLSDIGLQNTKVAFQNFSIDSFKKNYQQLFKELRQPGF